MLDLTSFFLPPSVVGVYLTPLSRVPADPPTREIMPDHDHGPLATRAAVVSKPEAVRQPVDSAFERRGLDRAKGWSQPIGRSGPLPATNHRLGVGQ